MAIDPPYRTDLINAAMRARRLTNRAVADKAGVGVMTVSKIRNGNPRVGYVTLKRVVEALGLTVTEVSKSRAVRSPAASQAVFDWPEKSSESTDASIDYPANLSRKMTLLIIFM